MIEEGKKGNRTQARACGSEQPCVTCPKIRGESVRDAPTLRSTHICKLTVKNVLGRLRQSAGQSYCRVVLTRLGVKAKITGGRAFSVVEALG
jgi:hypothetical protein